MTLPNTQWSHGFFPVRYGDRNYLIQYGEHGLNSVGFGGLGCTSRTLSPFQYPNIIDISNERRPRIVATLVQEIGEPARCASALNFDRPAFPRNTPFIPTLGLYAAFSYGTHLCRPDKLDNPAILACSGFASGLRVYDIRNPHAPKELAYFNPGTLGPTDPAPDLTVSPPVVRAHDGEIWFNSLFSGLQVVKFAPVVYPFKSS